MVSCDSCYAKVCMSKTTMHRFVTKEISHHFIELIGTMTFHLIVNTTGFSASPCVFFKRFNILLKSINPANTTRLHCETAHDFSWHLCHSDLSTRIHHPRPSGMLRLFCCSWSTILGTRFSVDACATWTNEQELITVLLCSYLAFLFILVLYSSRNLFNK